MDQTTGQLEGAMAAFTAGDDTPASGDQDKLWYKQDGSNCNLPGGFQFYNGTSTAWEPIEGSTPIGSIVMFGGTAAPTNWFLCNGGTFVVADYPRLDAVLGTTYGDAGTLPDLRSRVPVGYNTDTLSGRSTRALNASGGAEDVTLTGAESGIAGHGHTMNTANTTNYECFMTAGSRPAGACSAYTTATSEYTGSDGVQDAAAADAASAHENMQPFVTVNFIIRGL